MNFLRIKNSHKPNLIILLSFILVWLFSSTSFAQTIPKVLPTSSTAANILPASSPQIKCPAFYFNDQPALNSTSTAVNLGGTAASNCQQIVSGTWVDVLGVQTTVNNPSCPSNLPYMNGITEVGGGVFFLTFDVKMFVTCCPIPNPPVKMVSDVTSWIDGPTNGFSCP
jgi:hypothetical protein